MTPRRDRRLSAVLLLALAAALSGCSSPSRAGETTTTTVLPPTTEASLAVPGTTESGSLAFLGSVKRIDVTPVPAGKGSVPPAAPGTSSYRRVVVVGYRQFGVGSPLLLVAEEGATMTWWSAAFLQALSAHYRVTLFDLPGIGYSGPTAQATLGSFADLTAGLLSELAISRPTVLGWGLGGEVSVAVALRHPSLVGSLVLVDSGLPFGASRPPSRAAVRLLASGSATPQQLATVLFPPTAGRSRRAWVRQLAEQIPDVATAPALAQQARLETAVWHSSRFATELERLRLPVLVIGAGRDAVFPPEDSFLLAEAIRKAKRHIFRNGGDADFAQQPTQFVDVLAQFTG